MKTTLLMLVLAATVLIAPAALADAPELLPTDAAVCAADAPAYDVTATLWSQPDPGEQSNHCATTQDCPCPWACICYNGWCLCDERQCCNGRECP